VDFRITGYRRQLRHGAVNHARRYLAEAMTQAADEPDNVEGFMMAHSNLAAIDLYKFLVKWNASCSRHEATTLQAMSNPPTWADRPQKPPAEPMDTKFPDEDTTAPMELGDTAEGTTDGQPATKRKNEQRRKMRYAAKLARATGTGLPQPNDRAEPDEVGAIHQRRAKADIVTHNIMAERRAIEEKRCPWSCRTG
jgi:hypothetical protein